MEYLDIVNENGLPTGSTVSRDTAHRDGIIHLTAHVWIVRERKGKTEVLLQKRSMQKESFPGMYDTSSAGHIPAGSEPLRSALRELEEELGIKTTADKLEFVGKFHINYEKVFHNRKFRDNEITWVYVYTGDIDTAGLRLQETEVDEAKWFGLDEVWHEVQRGSRVFCVPVQGLRLLMDHLNMKGAEQKP